MCAEIWMQRTRLKTWMKLRSHCPTAKLFKVLSKWHWLVGAESAAMCNLPFEFHLNYCTANGFQRSEKNPICWQNLKYFASPLRSIVCTSPFPVFLLSFISSVLLHSLSFTTSFSCNPIFFIFHSVSFVYFALRELLKQFSQITCWWICTNGTFQAHMS